MKGDNMGRIYSNITWTIDNTPLVRLNRRSRKPNAKGRSKKVLPLLKPSFKAIEVEPVE